MPANHRHRWTYSEASAFLGKTPAKNAPTGTHSTLVRMPDGSVALTHYAAPEVVRWFQDGTATLSPTRHSATTLHRLKDYTAATIYSEAGEVYVRKDPRAPWPEGGKGSKDRKAADRVPLVDGLRIDATTGAVVGGA